MKFSFGFDPDRNKEAFEIIRSNLQNFKKPKNLRVFTIDTLYIIFPKQKDYLYKVMISKNKKTPQIIFTELILESFFKDQLIVMIYMDENGKQTKLLFHEHYQNKKRIQMILNVKDYQLKNSIYDTIQKGIMSLQRDEHLVVVFIYDNVLRKNDMYWLNGELIVTMYNIKNTGIKSETYEFTMEDYIEGLKQQNNFIYRVEKQRNNQTVQILYSKPNPNVLETVGRNQITPITSQSWQGVCVICYDTNDTSPLCQVNCPYKHIFHCHCIDQLFNTHQSNPNYTEGWQNDIFMDFIETCPICRNKITKKSVVRELSFGKKRLKIRSDIKFLK
jgi:hypothetical protein